MNGSIDWSSAEEGASDPWLYLEDVMCRQYRMERQCHPEYKAEQDELLMRVRDVNAYNWAVDGQERWRQVHHYWVTDLRGGMVDLEVEDSATPAYILRGELVPALKSAAPVINIKIYVTKVAIDHGQELRDDYKGLWMADAQENWYQIIDPHTAYQTYAQSMIYKTKNFLLLYDALMYLGTDVVSEHSANGRSCLYCCNHTIEEVHERASRALCDEKAGQLFDLQFVAQHAKFLGEYLKNTIDYEASQVFWESVCNLPGTHSMFVSY